uniref:Uncharacterized protein n=1 Tax=Nymphaea colorata TaxID=210225 RepID=A0A5K0YJ97_9MAGN|nr:unnamed protein product [Nymphaea colorata]
MDIFLLFLKFTAYKGTRIYLISEMEVTNEDARILGS